MVRLGNFYNKNIYNTEGEYVGKVKQIVLNIKKGRISFFKTKQMSEDSKNAGGLRDVLRNSIKLVPDPDEVEASESKEITENVVDIPYEIVTAVGDIIIIDQNKLVQYQKAYEQKRNSASHQKQPNVKKPMQKAK